MDPHLRERAERNLGSIVIAIEFTLISVMVGVILFPLMDHATPILRELKFEYMLYAVSGLALILYIWTEVISHSLSFIGWPFDIFHNLLYIIFAMVLAIQMHFLQDPLGWFAMTCVSAIVAAAISYYDLKLIGERKQGATGAAAELYDSAYKRQQSLVRLVPLTLANSFVQVGLILLFPVFFLQDGGHLILVSIQIIAFAYLLRRTIRHFKTHRDLITAKAIQELGLEQSNK